MALQVQDIHIRDLALCITVNMENAISVVFIQTNILIKILDIAVTAVFKKLLLR